MSAPVERVLAAVREGGLLPPGHPVVVSFSGGRDSTCLLDAVVTLARARDLQAPGDASATTAPDLGAISALHVNHGLRPEADADEAHCRTLCGELGVELIVIHAPPRPATGNVQAWARDVRYEAGFAAAADRGALLAVGHTASDQAETILYRLAASPGRRALLGMPARRGDLVRPLLAVTREETTAYCRERGLAWIEDPSNDSAEYARARVRHGLLPALRAVHPAAEASVRRTADVLRAEAEVLDDLVAQELGSEEAISLERLAALKPAPGPTGAQPHGRTRGVERAPERAVPTRRRRPAIACPSCWRWAAVAGAVRSISAVGCGPWPNTGRCAWRRPDSPTVLAPVQLPVPGRVTFGAWEIECATVAGAEAQVRSVDHTPGADVAERAVLDLRTLGQTLTVRAWRHGDRMRPLGLNGSKALSDLFTDRRVPRSRRAVVPVIASASEIVWVPGVAISESARIGAGTERAAELIARPS